MLATAKKALMPLLLSAAVTAVAGAQQKAKECEVDEGKPGEVARAMLALQVAQNASKPEDAQKQLKNAIASLEKADRSKNPVGENFVYGKTLVMWLSQPNMTATPTRGALGFTQNPTQPIDLIVSIDSAFGAETAGPLARFLRWQPLRSHRRDSARPRARPCSPCRRRSPLGGRPCP